MGPPEPPKTVLGRALTLLTAFRPGDGELTLAELARRTGLPKPTAHRMLAELAQWNVVERTPDGIRLRTEVDEMVMERTPAGPTSRSRGHFRRLRFRHQVAEHLPTIAG